MNSILEKLMSSVVLIKRFTTNQIKYRYDILKEIENRDNHTSSIRLLLTTIEYRIVCDGVFV